MTSMNTRTIALKTIFDLDTFIKKANAVDGDVLVYRGKFVVDGKSVLGVMSLDLTDGFIVEYPSDAIEFEQFLSKYEVY